MAASMAAAVAASPPAEGPVERQPETISRLTTVELLNAVAESHAVHHDDDEEMDAGAPGASSLEPPDEEEEDDLALLPPASAASPTSPASPGTAATEQLARRRSRAKLIGRLRGQLERAKLRAQEAPFVKFRDKLMFTAGVINFGLTCYIAGACPAWMPEVYSCKFALLLALRLYLYRRDKFGYFLLDFCYLANVLLLAYLWLAPQNVFFFRLVFAFANGPLGTAVIAWRNSLVFHSLDKTTSLFIHIEPVMVTYVVRQNLSQDPAGRLQTGWQQPEEGFATVYYQMLLQGLVVYMAWQVAYYVKVQVLDIEKIRRRNKSDSMKKYVTSFTYMREQRGALGSLIRRAPRRLQHYAFGCFQLLYTVVTLSFVPLLYFSPRAHFAWGLFLLGFSCWNGSCFYFEVFSARYEEQLRHLQASSKAVEQIASLEAGAGAASSEDAAGK